MEKIVADGMAAFLAKDPRKKVSTRDGDYIALVAQINDRIGENPVLGPFSDIQADDWVV